MTAPTDLANLLDELGALRSSCEPHTITPEDTAYMNAEDDALSRVGALREETVSSTSSGVQAISEDWDNAGQNGGAAHAGRSPAPAEPGRRPSATRQSRRSRC